MWCRLTRTKLTVAESISLLKLLLILFGRDNFESLIQENWHYLPTIGRANIAATSSSEKGITLMLLTTLFWNKETTKEERCLLLSGLAISAKERGIEANKLLFDLLDNMELPDGSNPR